MSGITIANVPEEIYLVFEFAEEGDDFGDYPEVPWCADRMSDSDVKFVRADRVDALERENAELREQASRWEQLAETQKHIIDVCEALRDFDAALQPKEQSNAE